MDWNFCLIISVHNIFIPSLAILVAHWMVMVLISFATEKIFSSWINSFIVFCFMFCWRVILERFVL